MIIRMPVWRNGRRSRLKIDRRNPWGFDSLHRYHPDETTPLGVVSISRLRESNRQLRAGSGRLRTEAISRGRKGCRGQLETLFTDTKAMTLRPPELQATPTPAFTAAQTGGSPRVPWPVFSPELRPLKSRGGGCKACVKASPVVSSPALSRPCPQKNAPVEGPDNPEKWR